MNFSFEIMASLFITSVLAMTSSVSTNWAGLAINSPSIDETFNFVTGQFTVPLPQAPQGAKDDIYKASIWVGIDGTDKAILQAGFDIEVEVQPDGSQKPSYNGWYEWLPLAAANLNQSQFSMMAGDEIKIDITISSFSTGAIVLTNLHTSQVFSKTLNAPDKKSNLEAMSVEWIIEDFGVNGKLVNLANFGTVNLTNCVARTQNIVTKFSDANVLTLVDAFVDHPNLLSKTTVLSDTSAQITYTGK